MKRNRPIAACLIALVISVISGADMCRAESSALQATTSPAKDGPTASPPATPATKPATAPADASTQPATDRVPTTWPAGLRTRDEGSKQIATRDQTDMTDLMLQMLASILVVFVLGVAAFLVVRKLLPKLGRASGRNLGVLETVYLGPRKSLHLVRIGRRRFLVAASRENVSMLAEVSDTDTDIDADTGDSPAPESSGGAER